MSNYFVTAQGLIGKEKCRFKSTTVDETFISNIITSGFPYRTYAELGCKDEDSAYIATQYAIWTAEGKVDRNRITVLAGAEDIYNGYNKILEDASKKTYVGFQTFAFEKLDDKTIEDDKDKTYVMQRFKIKSNYSETREIKIKASNLDVNITDENNVVKDTFKVDEIIKVRIPKVKVNELENVKIEADIKYIDNAVYFGHQVEESMQDIALCIDPYLEYKLEENLNIEKIKIPLSIYKKDTKTEKPLEGAVFGIYLEDKCITKVTTNKEGKAEYILDKEGEYIVKEIKAPNGYMLLEDVRKVEAMYNTKIDLSFSNEKVSKIIINKMDGETKNNISGVEFEITYSSGEIIKNKTDKNGQIILANLKSGKYKIKEINTVAGYEILKEEQEIDLEYGEEKNIEIVNYKIKEIEKQKLPQTGY